MSVHIQDDPRRKRARNAAYYALLTLIVIWTVKLTFPQGTAASVYSSTSYSWSSSSLNISEPAPPVVSPTGDFTWHYNDTIFTKVAIIIEDRPLSNIIPLVLHFASVLGPTWPIQIYTSPETQGHYGSSAALRRFLLSGQIQLKLLPSTILFANSNDLSAFLAKPWFWEQLAPAEHILLFQADSVLCSKAARSVEDFFEYDFVGAPIAATLGAGLNGGLSLRRRSTMLAITQEWNYDKTGPGTNEKFEDRWFWKYLHVLIARQSGNLVLDGTGEALPLPAGQRRIRVPDLEVARTFSVESIDFPHPLGLHQVGRFLKPGETRLQLDDWCPEYKLCYSGPRLA